MRRSSFSNPSAALPTSQLILQPFRCFTYAIGTSPTSTGEAPRPLWWCLIYSWWFCNVQWLRPAGLYERCKLALELKRLKNPGVNPSNVRVSSVVMLFFYSKHIFCLSWKFFLKLFLIDQGSSTFWVRGPIYIFHIILRAAVIADYKVIMDIWIVRNKDEDKIIGHSTVEQATTVSFTKMGEG